MRRGSGWRMANQEQIDRLKRAFRVASAAWDRAAARTVPGEIACRAGCFGCCVGLFDISLPEAALVRAGVARLAVGDREDVVRRARRIVEESAAAFPGDARAGLLDPDRSEDVGRRLLRSRGRSRLPDARAPFGTLPHLR